MNIIRRFFRWLMRSTAPQAVPTETPAAIEPIKQKRVTRQKVEIDRTQAHYYLGDLLEKLDEYFDDLKFLRRNDPEMGAVFEKFGCSIMSKKQLIAADVEPFFFKHLPAQGCFYFGRGEDDKDKDGDIVPMSFIYFTKHKQPINVQTTNGVTYVIGGVYRFKFRHVFEWHVSVFPDGTIKVLKEAQPRYYSFGKGSKRSNVARMEWGYPAALKELASNYNRIKKLNLTLDEFATELFAIMANAVGNSEMDMNVRVRKRDRVATFSINMLRTPYFFADRDKTVNENGKTKRILHIVRPHRRANGKFIKAHWRGARRFTWNGYDVSIGMPGTHYPSLMTEWAAAAYDEVDMKRLGFDGVELVEAAKIFDNRLTAPASNIIPFRGAA